MSDGKTDRASIRVPPPVFPLLTVVVGLVLDWIWPLDWSSLVAASVRYWVGGLIIAGAFLGLGIWAVVVFRRSGESENPWKPTFRLVGRGPYRFTRNPMYLQMVLICIGLGVVLANIWILLGTPACMAALQRFAILPEEQYLERKFGDSYLDYKDRVRRWL